LDLSRLGLAGLGGMGLGSQESRLNAEARMLFEQKQGGGLGGGGGLHTHSGHQEAGGLSSKDWQEGLRALLPNVNVSFGNGVSGNQSNGFGGHSNGPLGGLGHGGLLSNQHSSSQGQGLGQHFGLHNNYQGSFSQERLPQHNSNWGNSIPNGSGMGNDWTMLDPAIVTGQLAPPGSLSELPSFPPAPTSRPPAQGLDSLGLGPLSRPPQTDSPPNWITANLDQLTADSGAPSPYNGSVSQQSLIPAFNGLGLGLGQGSSRGARGPTLGGGQGGWGGATQTPPPGFSHLRQSGGQGYPGFGALNNKNEVPKIGEF